MVRLTAALISAIHDGADITAINSLIVPHRDLDHLVGLEVCERLARLDLSDNRLSTLEGISLCTKLKWLSVAGNQLTSLKGIENLTKLTVLNASRNKLTSLNEVGVLTALGALIVNDNQIDTICRLDRLVNLNTIVLSRNPIRSLGKFASKLLSLKKLSMSHCQVQLVGNSLRHCVALEELRLAQNQISSLPQELEKNGRLRILDIGTNHVKAWADVQVLETLRSLVNVNMRGNPFCNESDYENQVSKRLPHLEILDGRPVLDVNRSSGKKPKKIDAAEKLGEFTRHKRNSDKNPDDTELAAGSKQTSVERAPDGATEEDRPFLELISLPEADRVAHTELVGDTKVKAAGKSKKRKNDSGVVSVIDLAGNTRPAIGKSRIANELLAQQSDFGNGGASTWDDPPPGPLTSGPNQLNAQVQGFDETDKKPYSRWALKKK